MQLKQDILHKDNEAQRESRKKDKLERDLRQAKSDLDAKSGEAIQLQANIERLKVDIARTEQLLKEKKVSMVTLTYLLWPFDDLVCFIFEFLSIYCYVSFGVSHSVNNSNIQ